MGFSQNMDPAIAMGKRDNALVLFIMFFYAVSYLICIQADINIFQHDVTIFDEPHFCAIFGGLAATCSDQSLISNLQRKTGGISLGWNFAGDSMRLY